MRLIKPSFEILEQGQGIDGVYKQIEVAGRTCYKSEDKITKDSAKKFVDMMINSGHGAMLEHGTIYLTVPIEVFNNGFLHGTNWSTLGYNKYTKIKNGSYVYITTNLRVIIENDLHGVLDYLSEPTEYHEKRVTVKFTCDRVTGESFLRHRVFSFARESTRYCNYSKDKFGNELTFIIPSWINEDSIKNFSPVKCTEDNSLFVFMASLTNAETDYFSLLRNGWKPEQARDILPFSIKSPLVMTGFVSDWKHFFDLRCDSHAHPQARELAIPLKEEFIKRGYLNN